MRKADAAGLGTAISGSLAKLIRDRLDLKQTFFKFVKSPEESPLPIDFVLAARKMTWEILTLFGAEGDLSEVAENQPFHLNAIGEALKIAGDPDWRIFARRKASYASGVKVGFRSPMPRTPAVFERKVAGENTVKKTSG